MKRLILISVLLILWLPPAWSLPLMPGVNDWPLCLSASDWNALEDQVWAETQKTVEEAVKAAVAPLKIEMKNLQIQRAVFIGTTVATTTAFLITLVLLRCLSR